MTSSPMPLAGPVRFEGFVLDPVHRTLSRNGEDVHLTAKAFDCLLALVERRDRVVTRAEMMDAVWPGLFVEDSNLTQNVSVVRKALGGGARDHRFIVTVPGRGYRFVADVVDDSSKRPPTGKPSDPAPLTRRQALVVGVTLALLVAIVTWWLTTSIAPGSAPLADEPATRVIAVLPFAGVTDEAPTDGLGMADAIVTRLSRLATVTVRPTSSVVHYVGAPLPPLSEIGRRLEVEAVLTGTLQHSEDLVRVATQLVATDGGETLWSGTFEAPRDDPFSVQDSVSRELVRALERRLDPEARHRLAGPRTESSVAYESYLEGRIHLAARTGPAMRQAETAFRRAAAADPSYALAWSGLADTLFLQGFYQTGTGPPSILYRQASEAAQTALALDDTLGEAHATIAYLAYQLDFDYAAAERHFQRALELTPGSPRAHHWYGWLLLARGRVDESRESLVRARELDPLSLIRTTALGMHAYFTGDFEAARTTFEAALAIDPDFGRAHLDLGLALEMLGRAEEAEHHIRRAREILVDSPEVLSALGHLAGTRGDEATMTEARSALAALDRERWISPYRATLIAVAQDDLATAFDALHRAVLDRSAWPVDLLYDPRLEPLRADTRFEEILRAAKLDDVRSATVSVDHRPEPVGDPIAVAGPP